MRTSECTTQWAKLGVVSNLAFVGREYIGLGRGFYLIFKHVSSREQFLYRANSEDNGIGISAFGAHKTLSVFAFAEKSPGCRIFVLTCPKFQKISILSVADPKDPYLELSFTESDYLLTKGDLPDFTLGVWNWRTGKKITERTSTILETDQVFRSNHSHPVKAIQFVKMSGTAYWWDIFTCGKKLVMMPHKIFMESTVPVLNDSVWSPEGSLFLLDHIGNVYSVTPDHSTQLIIKCEEQGDALSACCWYKGGILVYTSAGKLLHYKKSANVWRLENDIGITKPVYRLLSNLRDGLMYIAITGHVMLYLSAESRWDCLYNNETNFNDFCLVYPTGEYIVALSLNNYLSVFEVTTGQTMATLAFGHEALALAANPVYPYIGVTFAHGLLQLISVRDPSVLTILAQFRLSRSLLNSIYFTESGRIIVTADVDTGQVFVIEGTPGSRMGVVAIVNVGHQIADYILIASRTCLRLFVICVTSESFVAGDKLLRYCITKGKPNPDVKQFNIADKKMLYTKLYGTMKENRDRVFYAIPFTNRTIHEMETKRGNPNADLLNIKQTNHQMRSVRLHYNKHYILSYAYDGLATVYTNDFESELHVIMPHHRIDGGVLKAFVDPYGKHVISLGRDNVLVCHALEVDMDEGKRNEFYEFLESPQCVQVFEQPTSGCQPTDDMESKTWFEIKAMKRAHRERIECRLERNQILKDFKDLQCQVQLLLTSNIEGPENEILDVQEFNVDEELKLAKIRTSAEDCQFTKLYLDALITAQNQITRWIMEYCWNGMFVQGKTIRALYENFEVSNYTLLPPNGPYIEKTMRFEEYRKLEKYLSAHDSFQPWIPYTKSELLEALAKVPVLPGDSAQSSALFDFLGDEEQVSEAIDYDSITAYNGSVSHMYIELNPCHYTQHQLHTFYQGNFQTRASMNDVQKIKEHFNKKFEDTVQMKIREMNNVVERNSRLRYIISELEFFAKESLCISIFDPEWSQKEQPERILKTEDGEVGITPYISPSEQALLDEAAAEAERIRLALLADDFRERALMEMMNGVLEIRWEDELKKDVPKPKCLLVKDPMDYDQDDLRAIRDYEAKVKFLNSERDKYRSMLETEYSRLSNTLREGVKKFNLRLSELSLTKIKVDSAIGHENLLVHRDRLKNHNKNLMDERERSIELSIVANDRKIKSIQELLSALHAAVGQCRSEMDTLQTKDKQLEKAFKKDFSQSSSAIQEMAIKIYRKRPKILLRSVVSVTVMKDLAKCLNAREPSLILNSECLEFMKAVDTLDQFVGILPPIDEHMFGIICKHRRLRIEMELKLRAAGMETSEAESTVSNFQKNVSRKKEYHNRLVNDLETTREKKLFKAQNKEIQVVVKQGLVEMPTSGKLKDFDVAVMVRRSEVEEINKIILRSGRRKVKAVQDTINLHRDILAREWEHKRLRMIIEDLKTQLYHIEQVKVTKEIQSYLKAKARGDSPDKSLSFEQEVELLTNSYQKIVDDKIKKIREIELLIASTNKENHFLNKRIAAVNVDVCEYQLKKDHEIEQRLKDVTSIKMKLLLKRARLVKEIQNNQGDIMVAQTELELLRLRTFPTLDYKILPI